MAEYASVCVGGGQGGRGLRGRVRASVCVCVCVCARILDGDNFIEGYIADLGPFSTRLLTAERETLMYPNNLILTRPVLINPKTVWGTMGKVTATLPADDASIEPITPPQA